MLDQPLHTPVCETLVRLERAAAGKLRKNRAPTFAVFLDGELLLSTPRPLTDGSRALLARGYDSGRLMTVRVQGNSYDNFDPIKIGDAAKWTVEESDMGGLRLRRWSADSRWGKRPSGAIRPGEGVPVPSRAAA